MGRAGTVGTAGRDDIRVLALSPIMSKKFLPVQTTRVVRSSSHPDECRRKEKENKLKKKNPLGNPSKIHLV